MHAQDLTIDDLEEDKDERGVSQYKLSRPGSQVQTHCGKIQVVEDLTTALPHVGVSVFVLALVCSFMQRVGES